MKATAPIKFIVAVVVVYLLFKVPTIITGTPLPASVLSIYMILSIIVILLVMTSTDEGSAELFNPIIRVLYGRSLLRYLLLLILPLVFAYTTYSHVASLGEPSTTRRVVHPPPPSVITAYGKTTELRKMKNPFKGKGELIFKEAVAEGGRVYFERCFFCHGAKLDGKGHLARGMVPKPLPFTGSDTIAQLEEAYVFWRIAKGGEGLPPESSPELSVMPAWDGILTEDEVWQVVSFIYDYTGNVPRAWAGGVDDAH
ncbi:MAG: cytochrome c [Deltaproteobacteria bacterium]|nr:cytochrome c [Deltaproteobacteria bacterium]